MDITFPEQVVAPASRGRGEPMEPGRQGGPAPPTQEAQHVNTEPMGR